MKQIYGTEVREVQCPYCGEPFEIIVDTSVHSQEYIEDCYVCCRPITIRLTIEDESIHISALHENDY